MPRLKPVIYATLLSATFLSVTAFDAHATTPLFPDNPDDATPLQLTLSTDLDTLMREGAEEQAGTLTLKSDEASQTFQIKVSPRGRSRQQRCRFFPLWLNFKKSEREGTLFAGQNKLKLVTHCNRTDSGKGYVGAEMLVYRLFNLLTDQSFRVRAVEMTYEDADSGRTRAHPAFLIEHKKTLAKRLDATSVDDPNPRIRDLHPEFSNRLAMFQYMVGNTDFSLVQGHGPDECCHNAVPFTIAGDERGIVSIPYDFDATGFVDVPYAAPIPSLGIKRLTQRLFRGYCDHNDLILGEIEHFQDMRSQIEDEIENFKDLPNPNKKKQLRFLEGFYKTIESERAQQKRLYNKCR